MKESKLKVTHLIKSCHLAIESRDNHKSVVVDGPNRTRLYSSRKWDCGTACCLYGFAHLLATGQPVNSPPIPYGVGCDFSDLHIEDRQQVWQIIRDHSADESTAPEAVLEILSTAGFDTTHQRIYHGNNQN